MLQYTFTDEVTEFIIERVHAEEYLWNPANPLYKVRPMKNNFWVKLTEDINTKYKPSTPVTQGKQMWATSSMGSCGNNALHFQRMCAENGTTWNPITSICIKKVHLMIGRINPRWISCYSWSLPSLVQIPLPVAALAYVWVRFQYNCCLNVFIFYSTEIWDIGRE